MKSKQLSITVLSLSLVIAILALYSDFTKAMSNGVRKPAIYNYRIMKRSADHKHDDKHKAMMHNHLSRKVFDRACAASKDSIDEIVACVTTNEAIMKAVDAEVAQKCYKDTVGEDFDPKEMAKHKDLICKDREKLENLTSCIFSHTAGSLDSVRMEKLTEAMVDVGLCIINALDG